MKVWILFKSVDDYECYEDQAHYTEVWGVFLDKLKAQEECDKKNKQEKIMEKNYKLQYYVTECETDKVYNVDDI